MTKEKTISIRKAKPDDQEEITNLFRETVLNIDTEDYSDRQMHAWASRYEKSHRWSDRIRHQHFLIAVQKDKIIGFGSATSDGYIDTLFVHKNHQGKGIGGMLLESLQDYIIEMGRIEAHLDASLTARTFFEKNGFRMLKPQQKVIDGVVFVNFMMVKKLKS